MCTLEMGKASNHGVGFFFFFFALSSIRNYKQNLFNDILLHLRKVLIQARKVFEAQKDSEPTENPVLELLSPEGLILGVYLMSLSSQSVQNKVSYPTIAPLSSQVRFLYLEKSQGFSTGKFSGLWEGISIPAGKLNIFIVRHKTLCQVATREITTLQSNLLILPNNPPF